MTDLRECDRSCRGHAWFETEDTTEPDRTYYHRWVDRCERCTTVRVVAVDRYGEIVYRDYHYPDGWSERWGGSGTRPSGAQVRLMMTQKRTETRRTRR
jgi:hypothetical protein